MSYIHTIPVTGFVRLPQILSLVPVSRSSWWLGCQTGKYPKPIKLSRRVTVWRAEDIRALIERIGSKTVG